MRVQNRVSLAANQLEYNVFAIEAGKVLRIDDLANRDEARAAAGLEKL